MTTTYIYNDIGALALWALALPFALAAALICALWTGAAALLSSNAKLLGIGAGIGGALALCLAYPLLPLGLTITAAVGFITYPRR